MSISEKVGALLGKKLKSEDATFGESLNLGQIAMTGDVDIIENSLNIPDISEADGEQDAIATMVIEGKRPSILDLDFMAAPLAEIELAQGHKQNTDTDQVEAMLPQTLRAETTVRPSPQQQDNPALPSAEIMSAALPFAATQPAKTDTDDSHLELLTPAIAQPYSPAVSPAEQSPAIVALAQSLREDQDAGLMMFGPDSALVESTDKFYNIVDINEAERASIITYKDMLHYMGRHADLGDKDVGSLSDTESVKMRKQLATGVSKSYKWTTSMRSGKMLEFSNSYTSNNHLITRVRDVTEQVKKDRLLHAGLVLGTAGYWSYSFATGKSTLSEYITHKLSPAEQARVEALGIISIIHDEDTARVQAAFDTAVSDRSRMDCEFRVVLEGDKELIMRMIGKVELSPSSKEPDVFIAFLNDLTEDRQRRKELKDIKELSKNKSEFLARMSHEIKTPLNAIVGMTDALRDEVDNDEARETASFIADAAENLNNILSQTLEHERLSTSEIILDEDIIDLSDVVRSTAAMWKKPCADKGLKLNIRVSSELPHGIKIDSSRFRQCLTNLLSNAVKFTDKGSIVVAVAPMNMQSPNPKILVAVRDTGIGMCADAIDKVFKPFQQGNATIHRRFGGSGLGMSITQRIVDAMDGHIKIKSVEGEGATIAITLPLHLANAVDTAAPLHIIEKEQTPAVKTEALPAEVFHPQAKTTPDIRKKVPIVPREYSGFDVLVVEDNPINQAVVRKLLTNHIQSMDFAFHGQEAMEILETKSFDVILMDIHMPVKDGIETTLEIRNSGKAWADTVIIALTADPDYQQKRVCRNIGMNDALSKPVKRQELLDVLQRVLTERQTAEQAPLAALSA